MVSKDGTVPYREFERWAIQLFDGKADALFEAQMDKIQGIVDDAVYMESLRQRLVAEDEAAGLGKIRKGKPRRISLVR